MENVITHSAIALRALETEATARIPGCKLVTVDIERLGDTPDLSVPVTDVRVMKTSKRMCFLQAIITCDQVPVLKARAIFKLY